MHHTKPSYHRLTLDEREEFSRLLAAGCSLRAIAHALHRAPSTMSRELARNNKHRWSYRACLAERRRCRQQRLQGRRRLLVATTRLYAIVIAKLRLRWSPEQIAAWLRIAYPHDMTMRVRHETIYQTIYVLPKGVLRTELIACLRQHRKRRYLRTATAGKDPGIPHLVSIDERPHEVATRRIPGHWEGDLIIGRWNRSALGTIVERTSRFLLLVATPSNHAVDVCRAFTRTLTTIPLSLRRSMTYDRGREMVRHEQLTRLTKLKVYFAHPSSPWERGTNEHTNMLVRQFFPKKTDFTTIPLAQIRKVQDLINGRPRKILGWKTPAEVFAQCVKGQETFSKPLH